MRFARRIVTLWLGVLSASCHSSATSPLAPGIAFLAGDHQSDTIQAILPESLSIQVANSSGQEPPLAVIQFAAVPVDSSQSTFETYIATHGSVQQPTTFLVDTLSVNGRVKEVVILGTHAGRARLVVRVPALGLVDTATFTVRPGTPVTLHTAPVDTTVFNRTSLTLRPAITDRAGNVRSDTVRYAIGAGSATVSGYVLSSTGYGMASVIGSIGQARDTTSVAMVPLGTLAAATGTGIVTFNLDGSKSQQVVTTSVGALKWATSGQAFVFDQATQPCIGTIGAYTQGRTSGIYTADLAGRVTTVTGGQFNAIFPQFTRDGQWIVYTEEGELADDQPVNLWRVQTSGANDDSLNTNQPDRDEASSPSPQGDRVVYVADHVTTSDLRILSLTTSAVTSLGISGYAPEWSPTSDQIAYLASFACAAPIAVVNADGSGGRPVTSAPYYASFDWSPDGQWLVALNATTNQIDVIQVSSGMTIPLRYTSNLSSPSWKP